MSGELHDWLNEMGLGDYAEAFFENKIDWEILPDLTSDDLKDMGVTAVGDRRRLLAAIEKLGTDEGDAPAPTGEAHDPSRRQVTILFSDLTGFTALTSSMDAEDVHALLNRYFMAVDTVVKRYGGRIDKHIGDAVMAVFGAPVAHTNDPERAARAALEIQSVVAQLDPPLAVHVGVASGQVLAGITGSDSHVEYTVTGDSVNLASRLTDLADIGETCVSQSVQRAIGAAFHGESLGKRSIKGLKDPIEVWRLTGLTTEDQRQTQRFVGRGRELAAFAEALESCRLHETGGVHLLRGEPGIGKTRLLEELAQLAAEHAFMARRCTVLDFGAGEGQTPVQVLARGLMDVDMASSAAARKESVDTALRSGWTSPANQVHLNALLDLEQGVDLAETYAAMDNVSRLKGRRQVITDLISARCREAPLLIQIEDVHWADADALESFALIAATIATLPCLLVMTTRIAEDPIDDNWHTQSQEVPVTILDLEPLPAEDARLLTQDYGSVDSALLETCVERSGGNPLFLEQLLRNLDSLSGESLPGSIQGIVQARLDVLDRDSRRAIQAASVLGQRFSPSALAFLLNREAVDSSTLLGLALVRPAGDELYFTHALIRDGAYETLLKSQSSVLHRRAADWFAERDLTLTARHLDLARESGAAAAYSAAARQHIAAYRYDQAWPLLDRGLELDCAGDVRFDLICLRGEAMRAVGASGDAFEIFEQAIEVALGDEQLCRAYIGLAQAARQASRYDVALSSLESAEASAERMDADHELAQIHYIRGNVLFPLGRIDDSLVSNGRAIAFARKAGSTRLQVGALSGFGDANYLKGTMRTADDFYTQAIDVARAENLTRDLAANLHNRGCARLFCGQPSVAMSDTEESRELAAKSFAPLTECIALASAAWVSVVLDRTDQACELWGEGIRIATEIGAKRFEAQGKGDLARVLAIQGRFAEAREMGREGVELALEYARNFTSPKSLSALALALEDPEEQDHLLSQGAEILAEGCVSHCHFFFYSDAIAIMLARRDWAAVLEWAEALEDFTRAEPLGLMDLTIRQARLLVETEHGGAHAGLADDVRGFHREAFEAGVIRTLTGLTDRLPVSARST